VADVFRKSRRGIGVLAAAAAEPFVETGAFIEKKRRKKTG
jgi:hypothetical protein